MLFESEQKQTVKRRRCGGDFEHTQCFSMNSTFGIASKLKNQSDQDGEEDRNIQSMLATKENRLIYTRQYLLVHINLHLHQQHRQMLSVCSSLVFVLVSLSFHSNQLEMYRWQLACRIRIEDLAVSNVVDVFEQEILEKTNKKQDQCRNLFILST